MRREEIEATLQNEPFVPLKLHLIDGRKFDVPFKHVLVLQKSEAILFKGVKKEGSHVATGYEVFPFDYIDRIEQRPSKGGGTRRRKAS